MARTRSTRAAGFAVCGALMLGACGSGSDDVANPTVPTDPTPTDSVATESTTTDVDEAVTTDTGTSAPEPTDSSAPVDTSTTVATNESTVDSVDSSTTAPPIDGGDTAAEVLATFGIPPADLDTGADDPNDNRVVSTDDEEVITAYAEATAAQLAAFSTWPLDPRSPVLLEAPFTDRVLNLFVEGAAVRTEMNQVLDISGGLTMRPYVVDDGDDPDRVVVWDCQIDATFWKDVDTGEKAPPGGGYANVGAPGEAVGTVSVLVRVDGEWLVDEGSNEGRACS